MIKTCHSLLLYNINLNKRYQYILPREIADSLERDYISGSHTRLSVFTGERTVRTEKEREGGRERDRNERERERGGGSR